MRNISIILTMAAVLLLSACSQNNEKAATGDAATGVHQVVVDEVLQAESYTYLNVTENGKSFWIAITREEIKEGEELYYLGGLEMRNFESKDLGKTFDLVYFVDNVSKQPITNQSAVMTQQGMPGQPPHGKPQTGREEGIAVTKSQGGITIGELFANKKDYDGKTVRIRGKVVKVNSNIMGRNWVHLQDGTSAGDKFDLTVTTNESVNVGDVVTFEGVIALDKDFTAGYVYDVIMENAQKRIEQSS